MEIVAGGPHHHELGAAEHSLGQEFHSDLLLLFEKLTVLVERELVILELLIDLIIASIVQTTKHHSEEDAHVGMIVQGHAAPFLDKEEYQSVVVASLDCDAVEALLEVVGVFGTLNPELFQRETVHLFDKLLTTGVVVGVVKKAYAVSAELRLDTHGLHCLDKGLHRLYWY